MTKHILMIISLLATLCFSQSPRQKIIMQSGEYYYGEGISFSAQEAKDIALKNLTSQIAVHVASSFTHVRKVDGTDFTQNVESVLNTHSMATLKNVQTMQEPARDGQIWVFCYLAKTEVAKIFDDRKKLIASMFAEAENYANQLNMAYALKYYYFAAILLNSLPDEMVEYNGVDYTMEIPNRMNDILLNTRFSFESHQQISDIERDVQLSVTYKNRSISLLDFTFWDGANQVAVTARDGAATLKLFGASINFQELKLNIKYAYYQYKGEHKIINDLWALVEKPTYTECQKEVQLKKGKQSTKISPQTLIEAGQETQEKAGIARDYSAPGMDFKINLAFEKEVPDAAETIVQETNEFLKLLKTGDKLRIQSYYQNDPFLQTKVSGYVEYNNPKIQQDEIQAKLNQTKYGWELRRIRMSHHYPSIHKQTTEYLVLDFDKQGKLQDLNVCISDAAYKDLQARAQITNDWRVLHEIVKFLEKYRTAYITRDIKTIDLMFAEDALIIVGRIIQKKNLPLDMVQYQKLNNEPDYETIKLDKQEYLKRQKRLFAQNQDIFLDFSTFDINCKDNADSCYGIEMRQSYVSTGYADEGYLFLLTDFSEKDPIIYIRAWQPKAWDKDELIKTANFRIYK